MGFGDFISGSRLSNIFSQDVDTNSMTDFNPALNMNKKRLFSNTLPNQNPKPTATSPTGPTGQDAHMERYFKLLQDADANRPAMTAYEEALNNRPQQQDYAPSGWRRFAGALAGVGAGASGAGQGIAAAEHILRSPYETAMEGYGQEIEGRRGAAELEQSRISDYKQNLGAAANYGAARSTQESADFWKNREANTKDYSEQTERMKEDREYENTISEIDRRYAQTHDEHEKRMLEYHRDNETRRHNGALERIGATNASANVTQAGASVTSAGAAVTNAEANRTRAAEEAERTRIQSRNADAAARQANAAQTRADKYQPNRQTPEMNDVIDAREAQMSSMLGKGVIINNSPTPGPMYIVDPKHPNPDEVERQIRRGMTAALQQSYPDYQPTFEAGTSQGDLPKTVPAEPDTSGRFQFTQPTGNFGGNVPNLRDPRNLRPGRR